MASLSSSESEGRGATKRPALSAATRLQRAMETHAALQASSAQLDDDWRSFPTQTAVHDASNVHQVDQGSGSSVESAPSVAELASELQTLWQREQSGKQAGLPSVRASLQKIGPHEKDELLLHLLEQHETLRGQRSDAAALGEKIAAQLLRQQHEVRHRYREQVADLQTQLRDAIHRHPQVAALQTKVDELERSNREHEHKLRFAVQKLQRSRKREKELKMLDDPLWD